MCQSEGSFNKKIPQKTAPRGSAKHRVEATLGLMSLAPEVKKAKAIPPVNTPKATQMTKFLNEIKTHSIGKMKSTGLRKTAIVNKISMTQKSVSKLKEILPE